MSDIQELPVADGLKKILIDYGFTRQKILGTQPDNLAAILGIEIYVAKIICDAAKRKNWQVDRIIFRNWTVVDNPLVLISFIFLVSKIIIECLFLFLSWSNFVTRQL